jgi:hypothetical protein
MKLLTAPVTTSDWMVAATLVAMCHFSLLLSFLLATSPSLSLSRVLEKTFSKAGAFFHLLLATCPFFCELLHFGPSRLRTGSQVVCPRLKERSCVYYIHHGFVMCCERRGSNYLSVQMMTSHLPSLYFVRLLSFKDEEQLQDINLFFSTRLSSDTIFSLLYFVFQQGKRKADRKEKSFQTFKAALAQREEELIQEET